MSYVRCPYCLGMPKGHLATTQCPNNPANKNATAGASRDRYSQDGPGNADMRGRDLKGMDLTDMPELRDADLTGAELDGAHAPNVDFSGAYMSDVSAVNGMFRGADFRDTDMTGADLRDSDLTGAKFGETILVEAKLAGARLDKGALDECDTEGADFGLPSADDSQDDTGTSGVTSAWAASFGDPVDPPPEYGMIASGTTGAMLIEDGYLSPDAYDRQSYEGGGEGHVEPFSGAKDDLAYLNSCARTLTQMEEMDRSSVNIEIGGPVFDARTHRYAVESHQQGKQAGKAQYRFNRAAADTDSPMDVVVDNGNGATITVRDVGFAGSDESGSQMYRGVTANGYHSFRLTEIQDLA